jgi:aspartate kinase
MNSPYNPKRVVLKFGGASVATAEHFSHIAELIQKKRETTPEIVVVISAMGDTTNQLISLASQVHPNPPRREYDMLVSVGERISMALLAMALHKKGIDAISFTGSQSGIITTEEHSEAKVVHVRPDRLLKSLEGGKVVIVAGFQGVSQKGEITTLGRGGSDTTAVALAIALRAEKTKFYKDVGGIFSEDPKKNPEAAYHSQLTHLEAIQIVEKGAKDVLHRRALYLAHQNNAQLEVVSYDREKSLLYTGTKIGKGPLKEPPSYEVH